MRFNIKNFQQITLKKGIKLGRLPKSISSKFVNHSGSKLLCNHRSLSKFKTVENVTITQFKVIDFVTTVRYISYLKKFNKFHKFFKNKRFRKKVGNINLQNIKYLTNIEDITYIVPVSSDSLEIKQKITKTNFSGYFTFKKITKTTKFIKFKNTTKYIKYTRYKKYLYLYI